MPGLWCLTTGEGRQWWNKNRDYVVAGAVIIGTGGAALAYGGAAWGPTLWGAFSGELIGGYSAYQAGGDIISGVVVGGAVGAITGYAGGQAGTYVRNSLGANRFGYIAGGAVRGGIIGAGSGGVAGYKGGAGTSESIIRGMYRGAAVGAAAGGAFGYLQYSSGEGFGDMTPGEIGNRMKDAGMRGIKSAAESKNIGAVPGNILTEIGKEFGPLVINTLTKYPNVGYAIISLAVGVDATIYSVERYIKEHGIPEQGTEIKF